MNMDKIREFFKRDRFAELLGITIDQVSPGQATVSMDLKEEHLNGVGSGHGGAIFTLADFGFAVACNSHGTVAVAINVSISFVKAARPGRLKAVVREVSRNPKLGNYSAEVIDEDGDLVATFQGLAYRKNIALEDVK